jgi:hypothetical protein
MNMRYHHDYPYFRWNGFAVFKHYRPMIGQIIRGRIFPLFTRPNKNTKQRRKAKTPGKRESSHPPGNLMAGRKTQQAAEIKS